MWRERAQVIGTHRLSLASAKAVCSNNNNNAIRNNREIWLYCRGLIVLTDTEPPKTTPVNQTTPWREGACHPPWSLTPDPTQAHHGPPTRYHPRLPEIKPVTHENFV